MGNRQGAVPCLLRFRYATSSKDLIEGIKRTMARQPQTKNRPLSILQIFWLETHPPPQNHSSSAAHVVHNILEKVDEGVCVLFKLPFCSAVHTCVNWGIIVCDIANIYAIRVSARVCDYNKIGWPIFYDFFCQTIVSVSCLIFDEFIRTIYIQSLNERIILNTYSNRRVIF